MRAITVNYAYEGDKTTVTLGKEFLELPDIHQLDALRDALCAIDIIYQNKLKQFQTPRGE